jgi:tRNA(fMet)-specific endonuclease VapC
MTECRDYLLDSMMLGYVATAKCGGVGLDEKQTQKIIEKLQSVMQNGNSKMFISSISVGESEYGLSVAPNSDKTKQAEVRNVIEAFLPGLVLDVNVVVAREYYAKLRAKLFAIFAPKTDRGLAKKSFIGEWVDPTTQKALGIQENDLWIASIAMAHNLTLVSSDKMNNIRQAAGDELLFENWSV